MSNSPKRIIKVKCKKGLWSFAWEKYQTNTKSEEGDGGVVLSWKAHGEKFERIRRITGYLVGTIDRWNNAKRAEEKERVKHD